MPGCGRSRPCRERWHGSSWDRRRGRRRRRVPGPPAISPRMVRGSWASVCCSRRPGPGTRSPGCTSCSPARVWSPCGCSSRAPFVRTRCRHRSCPATAPRLAHYVLLDEAAPPGVVVGYDDTLARRVWIRHGTPGAPPVPLARRQVSRPSRLHWLAGGRDDSTAWDVYEMAAGQALRGACRQPRSWPVVRGWLFDLADEIVAASEDGTGVPLTPGRVWVTDARATLLDWDTDPDGGAAPSPTVARFLDDVATIGLGRRRGAGRGNAADRGAAAARAGVPDRARCRTRRTQRTMPSSGCGRCPRAR